VASSVSKGLRLVTDEVVPVLLGTVHLFLEELAEEGSRKVHGENLVGRCGVFGELLDSWGTDGQVETTDVIDLCGLNELPDLGGLEVLNLVLVGGGKLGNQGTFIAGNDDSTTSSGLGGIDEVLRADSSLDGAGMAELIGGLVVSDTSDVDNGIGGENVLGKLEGWN
jgi:hypothetical protein